MKKIDKKNNELEYKDEGKHSKFVSNIHFIHTILDYNPFSIKYTRYWKDIKRRCMEGYWHEGKWMPGNLYWYINLCKIRLNKSEYSTTKILARPFLRDLEWEKAYVFMESRGFSGFDEDEDTTCCAAVMFYLEAIKKNPSVPISKFRIPTNCYDKKGRLKKFEKPRTYLRKTHTKNLGKPLFYNEARNVIDIECRGGGKSFWGANGLISHTYHMDGMYDYDEFCQLRDDKEPAVVEVLVGAIDGKYTTDLLDKTALGIDNLTGDRYLGEDYYRCPLYKKHTGSWHSGKQLIENKYDVKIGGDWQKRGSGSKIYHRTFRDNPEAGNGIRTSLGVIEEVGFMYNLKDALGSMKDTTYNGPRKFGTIYMFGTGGNMAAGKSEEAMEVFNDPDTYDCLCFQDEWEESGDIGYFVPYELGLNEYKNKEGITDMVLAKEYVDDKRAKLAKGKSKDPLYKEMQNNPRVPSEAFLITESNIFPVGELKEHLNYLKAHQTDSFLRGQNGELVFTQAEGQPEPNLEWRPDLSNRLTPTWYKMKKSDDTTGCIQIWEHPQSEAGSVPWGLYVAGTDPYDQDKSVSTASLGSTFIYKTFHTKEGIYEWPVAEYTARPSTAAEHHENIRKLLLYYNCLDLYENERNTLKMHFEHKNSLYLLAKTPTILKASEGSKVNRTYGTHMTDHIKDELEIYTRDWLLKDAGDGKLNLHKINSIPLLEELIFYNRVGNFDRVIAFMLTICHRLMNYHIKVKSVEKDSGTMVETDSFMKRAMTGGFFNR